ncbi:hypothetical protein A1O7_07633 [Cladophialophora yegresii CBS 114405]|uniref:BTB domain-containing protein n=1 Tax=Cladophialophora yegresii CBS 114405 TaxID=1182544 RepID=W9VYF8_9EURO|nr:uncharacterized protein A1O7_07633 [Cladophialophora yegresii CBS 114405]EXJ57286.1 hypothetical protein A1O7_07633 [Cladophialophora yegresii CBS 114405]
MADADNTRNGRPARAGRKRKADEIDREDKKQGERRRVVEVVPNADVTFKVGTGEEARDIKVSGVVVSLASEVFSRMLSSSFIEGRTRVISLPEDDPETVLTFCQIVHHRAENLNRLGPGEPNKLAVFADMRLCTTALRPWVVMRLSPLIERLDQGSPKFWQHQEDEEQEDERNGNARDDIELFLPTMMLFRLEGMFWKSTRFLIWSTKPSKPRQEQNEKTESPRYDNIHGEYMQRMLWSELRAPVLTFADAVLQSARTSITSLLASVSECVDRGFEDSRKVLPCHISKYGFLMCVLRYKKIKTGMQIREYHSVHRISATVRDIVRRLRRVERVCVANGGRRMHIWQRQPVRLLLPRYRRRTRRNRGQVSRRGTGNLPCVLLE